jgi:(p)ppGpp synthase/HD superfamily hydrolase
VYGIAGQQPFVPSFLAERPLTRVAFELAAAAHFGQRRDADGVPYVAHPLEAAALLHSLGFDDNLTAAAVLHDVLEDTDLSDGHIEDRLDREVLDLVRAVTDDERISDEGERKAALRASVERAGPRAAAIFAADKLSKVRELRVRLSRDPSPPRDAAVKLEHYRLSLEMLERVLGRHPLTEQLRFELEALDALPPHGRQVK